MGQCHSRNLCISQGDGLTQALGAQRRLGFVAAQGRKPGMDATWRSLSLVALSMLSLLALLSSQAYLLAGATGASAAGAEVAAGAALAGSAS